jgi:hypothetical protein
MKNKIILALLAIPLTGTLIVGTAFASTTPLQPKTDTMKYNGSASTTKPIPNPSVSKKTDKEINDITADKTHMQAIAKAKADYKVSVLKAKTNLKAALRVAKNKQDKLQANKSYKDSVKTATLAKTSALKQAEADWQKARGQR